MTRSFWQCLGALSCLFALAGCSSGTDFSKINAVPPKTTAVSISGTSFDFGKNLVGNSIVQTVATLSNAGPIPLTLNPSLSGDPSYSIIAAQSCGTQLAPGSSCPIVVDYKPTTASAPASQTATIGLNFGNAAAGTPSAVSLTGTSATMANGTVTATSNPQVALYTITPPFAGTVTIQFGPTDSYGLSTWTQPTPIGGGPVSIEVAGMRANTAYHMRATVAFQNGITTQDVDHTFTTGSLPGNLQSQISATTTSGQTPQPGIEMLNPIYGAPAIAATDLQGNIIWTYNPPDNLGAGAQWYAPKQLANGDYIALASIASSQVSPTGVPAGTADMVREFDLAGNTVKQITMDQLNARLAAANFTGLTLLAFHHDVTVLPNGHWLVLANIIQHVTLADHSATDVRGDVIVDLDTNLNPVWVWNEFDHLDVNRHPVSFPDWTHTNAVVYSKDDGDLLVSMRHQSWVVKVNYANGTGDGSILWRLGEGGDFTLAGGVDPTDWFYGQHAPSFTTSNTSGIFGLTLMDNGNFRIFPNGVNCGTAGAPPCHYTTIPVLRIDETAKTATIEFHQKLPTSLYNVFGGNAEMLANGNIEYDLCGLAGLESKVFEVTNAANPQTVWQMTLQSNDFYRAYRLPSLYPGVQW